MRSAFATVAGAGLRPGVPDGVARGEPVDHIDLPTPGLELIGAGRGRFTRYRTHTAGQELTSILVGRVSLPPHQPLQPRKVANRLCQVEQGRCRTPASKTTSLWSHTANPDIHSFLDVHGACASAGLKAGTALFVLRIEPLRVSTLRASIADAFALRRRCALRLPPGQAHFVRVRRSPRGGLAGAAVLPYCRCPEFIASSEMIVLRLGAFAA